MPASPRDIERLRKAAETGRVVFYRSAGTGPFSEAAAIIQPYMITYESFDGRLMWQCTPRGFQFRLQMRPSVTRYFYDIEADSVAFAFPDVRRLSASGGAPWPRS